MREEIPLLAKLAKEGWTRHQENAAKPPLKERPGVVAHTKMFRDALERSFVSDHPVCAASVASRLSIDGAATPPFQGGEYASLTIRHRICE